METNCNTTLHKSMRFQSGDRVLLRYLIFLAGKISGVVSLGENMGWSSCKVLGSFVNFSMKGKVHELRNMIMKKVLKHRLILPMPIWVAFYQWFIFSSSVELLCRNYAEIPEEDYLFRVLYWSGFALLAARFEDFQPRFNHFWTNACRS